MQSTIYPGIFKKNDKLFTQNPEVCKGIKVYNEQLITEDNIEYRSWNPFRSKLAAALLKGLTFDITADAQILYLGAATGTTVSHISDIITNGTIYAVEIAPVAVINLLKVSEKRPNIIPILSDANHPERYQSIVPQVDLIYQDISQRNQADIFTRNITIYFKSKGTGLIMVKARSMNRIGEFERRVLDAVAASDDTHERLKLVVDACFVTATASNHRRFIITLMVEALDTNPRLSEQFRKVLRRMRGFLADVVADGQRRGTMRPDISPIDAAAVIAGTIMGAEIQHYQDPGEVELRRVLDAHLRQLADWLAPRDGRAGQA